MKKLSSTKKNSVVYLRNSLKHGALSTYLIYIFNNAYHNFTKQKNKHFFIRIYLEFGDHGIRAMVADIH